MSTATCDRHERARERNGRNGSFKIETGNKHISVRFYHPLLRTDQRIKAKLRNPHRRVEHIKLIFAALKELPRTDRNGPFENATRIVKSNRQNGRGR